MKTLLGLLAAVALLVWGTHIVRTGLLRVYGANLRRVLAKMTDEMVQRIVLDTAERLIREELEKIRQEPE